LNHPVVTLTLAAGLVFAMLVNMAQSRVIAEQRLQIRIFLSDSSHYFQLLGKTELQKQHQQKESKQSLHKSSPK